MSYRGDALEIFVLAVLVLAAFSIYWGLNSGSKVEIGNYTTHSCSDKLSRFSNEYGSLSQLDGFFLDGNDMYLIRFNNSWVVPFDGGTCKIEESSLGKEIFRTSSFKSNIANISDGFFSSTRDCIDIAGAKGASNICDVTGLGEDVLNFPVTKIVVKVPTELSTGFAEQLLDKGWTRDAVVGGIRIAKKVANSELVVGLDFLEQSSCSLKNTPKKAIFDLSDSGNQIFTRAKNNRFNVDTIPKLLAISEYVIALEGVNVQRPVPQLEGNANNDIIGLLISIPGFIISIISFFIATGSDATIQVINAVATPSCTPSIQIAKFQGLEGVLTNNRYVSEFNKFNSTLNAFKTDAMLARNSEQDARNRNSPDSIKWLFFPSKSILYTFAPSSDAQIYYDEQFYISSKTAAVERSKFFTHFWDRYGPAHIVITFSLWVLAAIALGIVYIKLRKSKPPNKPVNPSQPYVS